MTATPDPNKTGAPREVPDDVREKQDDEYSVEDFEGALDAVTRRLDEPAPRDPGSPRR